MSVEEKDLVFTLIRQFTPQWNVSVEETIYARVTQRFVGAKAYAVHLIAPDGLEAGHLCDDREAVVDLILGYINSSLKRENDRLKKIIETEDRYDEDILRICDV